MIDPQPLAVLAILALVLELYPVRLGRGYFSSAWAAYLAMALTPRVGPLAAGVVAVLAIGMRTVLWSGGRPLAVVLREALADLVPNLAGLATAAGLARHGLAAALPAGLVYVGLSLVLLREQQLKGLPWLGNWLAGSLLAGQVQASPWPALLFGPLLWMLQDSVRFRLAALAARRREELEKWTHQTDQALLEATEVIDQASRKLAEQSREIQVKTEERVLLEDLSWALARSPDLAGTLETLLNALSRIVRCQSVVFFLRQQEAGDELVPARWRTPHAARLGPLLKLQEPAVLRCWQERQPVRAGADPAETRIFADEPCAVALPLGDEGVLYVGRATQGEFSLLERYLLTLLAGQSTLAIQSARRFQAQHEAIALHAAAHARLGGWVDRLAFVLESSRRLAGAESIEEILNQLRAALDAAWPHQAGLFLMRAEGTLSVRREWPAGWWTPEILAEARRLTGLVLETGVPLLFDGADPRYPSLGAALPSLLVAPVLSPALQGAIVVGHGQPGVFAREHCDLLGLECYQAGALLERAALLERVVASHTQLEASQAELLQAYHQLELSQAQVVQSSKLAAIGQLAAGVAHELNTPLGAIVLALDIAAFKLGEDSPVSRTLVDALKAAERCRNIIAKLMLYSRSSTKGTGPLSLNSVVQDTLELLAPQLALDGVAITRELAPQMPTVNANFGELQQVLTNLLVNARDAVLEDKVASGGEVAVQTGAEGEWAWLRVSDRGRGIPPEVAERIFDPFFTTKPVGRGTGLGLTVSQQIMQQHGGRLEAESTPGQGTSVTMWLKADA